MSSIFNVPSSLITRGFKEDGALPPYRTEFMRDRDRILYATAFRRLAGKTQIYTVGRDDHKRNRLTHTLEVAQIARTLAYALDLNVDLAEAIALAHDFGHTPFGHAGEEMLHQIMIPCSHYVKESPFYKTSEKEIKDTFQRECKDKDFLLKEAYGFKHNLQSVRVSSTLEDSYRFDEQNVGLNLTNFTLYGMMIHSGMSYDKLPFKPNFHNKYDKLIKLKDSKEYAWSFEAYIVERADNIAQWHHDLEDALRGNALPLEKIHDTILTSLENVMDTYDKEKLDKISFDDRVERKTAAELSHIVVNTLVNDVVKTSRKNFDALKKELDALPGISSTDLFTRYDELDLKIKRHEVITFSDDVRLSGFKKTIKSSVHHSRDVERMNSKGQYIIRKLFEAYYAHPQQLPDGPILHLLVEINDNYKNIDDIKKNGVGAARGDFNVIMENPNIYVKSLLMRRICDHIASMTDHYAIEEYNNLYG